jgi:hypothetical protein
MPPKNLTKFPKDVNVAVEGKRAKRKMSFEVVKPKARIRPEEISVSIYRRDMLSMNKGTRGKYFPEVDFVLLLYDRDTHKVAIKPLTEDCAEAFRLRQDKTGRGATSLRSLSIQFQIELPKSGRFPARWDTENEWLEFSLTEESVSKEDEEITKLTEPSTVLNKETKPEIATAVSTPPPSIPRAIEPILTNTGHPMNIDEIYRQVIQTYPNISQVVQHVRKEITVALLRGVEAGKYEKVQRGIYKMRNIDLQ